MLRLNSESPTDFLQLTGSGRILPTGHSGREIVRDADRDACPGVDTIQKTCHAAVGERGVADHSHGRPHARIGGAESHGDGSPHLHARLERVERRHVAKGVATDVTEHTGSRGIFLKHSVKCRVEVAVSASLT